MAESIVPASRADLPAALIALGLTTVGVEVGTYEGHYAAHLLTHWPGFLHCVDPYLHQPGWKDILNHDDLQFEAVNAKARETLKPWLDTGRCLLHEVTSLEAANYWWATNLDFVYLDARHDYQSVSQDIRAWFPKIKHGGVIAGHDYMDATIGDTVFEVKRAVRDWLEETSYPIEAVGVMDEAYPSWFLRKRHD